MHRSAALDTLSKQTLNFPLNCCCSNNNDNDKINFNDNDKDNFNDNDNDNIKKREITPHLCSFAYGFTYRIKPAAKELVKLDTWANFF